MFAHKPNAKKNTLTLQAKAVSQNGLTLKDNRSNTVQLARGPKVNFSASQRDKILTKNRTSNGGFHTCSSCGFQHGLRTYATYRGRRTGDGGFQVDHIRPVARGGRPLIRNAAVLCGTCNTSKGSRARAQRFGINKYRGLHRKMVAKDYRSMRRNY